MRRFSQRNSLVTLSDINITPLLDLAFVLLIIFVITTPLLEKSIELRLPEGGQDNRTTTKDNLKVVEVDKNGAYWYDRKRIGLSDLETQVVTESKNNPNFRVRLRADREVKYDFVVPVLSLCGRHRISVSLATEPSQHR